MPRKSRKETTTKVYHIVTHGLNKEYIFEKEKYMEKYIEILEAKKEADIEILAYCIMNNHAHLLIYSSKIENISRYMQRVNTTYSLYYNRIKKRKGYVFKDRFYSQNIESLQQLYNCIKYIHNNPVKAKICIDATKYKYSSINKFIENEKRYNFIANLCSFNNNKSIEEDNFIDVKDLDIEDYINEVKMEYNLNLDEVKNDIDLLKKIILEARSRTEVTIVELAKILGISKSTVSKYIKSSTHDILTNNVK